jgi:hypothetical protein
MIVNVTNNKIYKLILAKYVNENIILNCNPALKLKNIRLP